jgi:hypothetical protein
MNKGISRMYVLRIAVVSLYAQARDAAQQEEEEECADPNLRKGDYQEKDKGVA